MLQELWTYSASKTLKSEMTSPLGPPTDLTDSSYGNVEQDLRMGSMVEFHQKMVKDSEEQKPLVPIVARLLAKLVDNNDKLPADKEITVFHAQKAPAVNVVDYAERIAKYSSCSPCCFVVGVIYIDRFVEQQRLQQREFKMNSLNVHRLMLSSIMVAAKFLDDFYYSNEFWAKIGGVPNGELNTLELEFLFLTNFDLHIERQVYDRYRECLLDWSRRTASGAADGAGVGAAELLASGVPKGCLWEVQCPGGPKGPPSPLDGGGMEVEGDVSPDDSMAMDS